MTDPADRKPATRIIHSGKGRGLTLGGVNPVVQRASTVLLPKAEDLYKPGNWTYGIHGTATHTALEEALCALEKASHVQLVASGLLACTLPILAIAESGGHVLVYDNVYGPTRRFCDRMLKRWNCEVEYVPTNVGGAISEYFRPNTKLVFLESPGSLTFEILDTPAIADAARNAGIPTIMDNTWGAGLYHRPLDLGVDISVQALSKYAGGASDILLGSIATRDNALAGKISAACTELGQNVSPDDAYLALRGLRTMETRLRQHHQAGLAVAEWLAKRPEVNAVLHPALPGAPGYDLWTRDFSGAAGLFGFVLNPASEEQVFAFLNALEVFGLGFSWGGFESLAIHCDPQLSRTAAPPNYGGPLMRLSIGLEEVDDLIADLQRGFAAL